MKKYALAVLLTAIAMIGCMRLQSHFVNPKVVENITSVKFPAYKVIGTVKGPRSFNGDGSDRYTLEFKQLPNDDFYAVLDQNEDFFKWNEDGTTTYSFERIWGNGLPAPKGESDNDDYNFRLKIEKGSKQFSIEVMVW